MSIFKDVTTPTNAIADLWHYLRVRRQYKPLLFFMACLPPGILLFALHIDAKEKSLPPPPEVIYFKNWTLERSREEILADYKINAEKARIAAEKRKETFKAIGRASGMDVERIEAEALAEKAADEKAAAEKAAKEKKQPEPKQAEIVNGKNPSSGSK
ncbi:hypothetical protein LPB140_02865 [Sphingorhabdus lutea]|uniref:Uncharacterized protein n=1 Tax=Sphingorhabdus lutea TaxID=1913578 RepID=A0A1L3J9Z3_9SPHN|nr:hypothetical protein [Sphingorhabdus lutea]APG61941.1 hypothetical protein LPB140_02865 [Sphingorhabdus lutea]